jgi:DNA-binding protein H-NS
MNVGDVTTFRPKRLGRLIRIKSGNTASAFSRNAVAAYVCKVIFNGEAPMAKASPGRPRVQRAHKPAAQEAPSETLQREDTEQPAYIKALESLNIGELRRVIAFAEVRIREREVSEKAAAREELQKLAQERGFSMADLFANLAPHAPAKRGRKPGGEGKSERAPVEAKYRGPNGETWSGRGRLPKWLHAAEAEGKSRDSFLINPE